MTGRLGGQAMLIAQMTDIHIGFAPDEKPEELNYVRFRATLARILASPNKPDLMVVSGDITDRGDIESFEKTAALLADCPVPVWPMVGNHDTREALIEAFPHVRLDDGFLHYGVGGEGLRVLLLDTFEAGRHGGAFCERRAAWLTAQLDAAPDTPTLIFMHHPPVVSGIDWMDPEPGEGWVQRFGAAVEGREQILAIHCGHLHRPLAATFRGIPLHVTPSVAPLVALDLRPTDPDHPDNRDLITTEPPSYALHLWDGANLVTHYERVSGWHTMARYTEQLQPMIQGMFAERG
jgi:3',5'-cyclic AMP phosphodiesterase CpdA